MRHRLRLIGLLVTFSLIVVPQPAAGSVGSADRLAGRAIPASARVSAPDVSMGAGYLGTADGRELWSRAADQRRPMASTTKIMTAVVVLSSGTPLDDAVTVSAAAAKVGEAQYNLRAGDVRTVRQLLEEMLVKSGNDAAAALAEHVAGSQERFVELMNRKAADLGLKDTHYLNPHGLDAPGHYTTAHDLATLARYAMRTAEFRRIVALPSVRVMAAGSPHTMENTNLLLGEFDGMVGIKTGMTDDAGWCLVSQVERGRVKLLAVVLGTGGERERVAQSRKLLEWGLEHYAERRLASQGETMGIVPVSDYLDVAVAARVGESTSTPLFDLDGPVTRTLRMNSSVKAPVAVGDQVGTLVLCQGSRVLGEVPVTAASAVPAPRFWERVRISLTRLWLSWFGRDHAVAETASVG